MRIGRRPARDHLFDGFAAVAAGLASGRRAEIIEVLAQGERTVEQIAAAIDQTLANTSHHMRTLARVGLVAATKQGRHVTYRLASNRVYDLWAALRDVTTAHHPNLPALARAYLGNRSSIQTVTRSQFEELRSRNAITIIDVRPRLEYEAGHIPGAIHVPPDELASGLADLNLDRDVVAYCRGPYCVYADQSVLAMRASGQIAYRLEDGYPEWRRSHSTKPA